MRPQNTIEDVVSLFGENLHGKVINGPWCLKMAFGLILLSFLLSFCYRFVSRKFSPFVGHTYTWSSPKGWRST